MTDRPILFSAPMIRAILDGRKTQTRRVLKPTDDAFETPKFRRGDRLWVRETHAWPIAWDEGRCELARIWYPAGTIGPGRTYEEHKPSGYGNTRPSIHMPRWASRLTLIVEDVRVQRLQDISEADAWAEGCERGDPTDNGGWFPAEEPHPKGGMIGWDCSRDWFSDLWDGLNAPRGYGWDANPWVVAITFRTIRANIDSEEARDE